MCKLDNIIEKCKKGDPKAAEELYKLFASRMFAICLRYSQDRSEAEDHLQDGFLKVFESIAQYSGRGSFEGWMKRIFIHIIFEKYRKNNRIKIVEEVPEMTVTDVEENIYIPEDILFGFIEELPEKYRQVFQLYAIDEMQHKEIAALAGISEGTSKSNLARARDILKRKIKDYLKYEH